jgi:hypothetical protein
MRSGGIRTLKSDFKMRFYPFTVRKLILVVRNQPKQRATQLTTNAFICLGFCVPKFNRVLIDGNSAKKRDEYRSKSGKETGKGEQDKDRTKAEQK